MKHFLRVLSASVLALTLTVPTFALSSSDITAETAVLIDADTGQVLYDKKMHVKRHPASITKIMTGLLAVENASPSDMVTVSQEAVMIPYNSSHMALSADEEISVDNLMYGLMLPSANDAANALAEYVSGDMESFAEMMTQRAQEMGALDTKFLNPSGLPEDDHLTTAYDMAVITKEAIKNPDFMNYFGADYYEVPPTNVQDEVRYCHNQHFMLREGQWVYNENVIGGKVGYTDEARHTMSTVARIGDRTLIAVVMGCGYDQRFDDTQDMFDFGFDSFRKVEIPADKLELMAVPVVRDGETVGEAVFSPEADALTMLLPTGKGVDDILVAYNLPDAVSEEEQAEASITLTVSGAAGVQMEVPLTAALRVDVPLLPQETAETMAGVDDSPLVLPSWLPYLAIIPAAVLVLLLLRTYKIRQRAKQRQLRRQRILQNRQRFGA